MSGDRLDQEPPPPRLITALLGVVLTVAGICLMADTGFAVQLDPLMVGTAVLAACGAVLLLTGALTWLRRGRSRSGRRLGRG